MMDVNFMGTCLGARAAIPVFRTQGEGHLVVVSSIVGRRGIAQMCRYAPPRRPRSGSSSRCARIRRHEHPCERYARCHRDRVRDAMQRDYGHAVRGLGPKQSADTVAAAVVRCLHHPIAEVYPHRNSRGLTIINALAPGFTDGLVRKYEGAGNSDRAGHTPGRSDRARGCPAWRPRTDRGRLGARSAARPARRRTSIWRSSASSRISCAPLTRFGSVNAVGESFTVYKVGGIDVSLPRRDSKTGEGHRGFTVAGDPTMSVADAARRRDFTSMPSRSIR